MENSFTHRSNNTNITGWVEHELKSLKHHIMAGPNVKICACVKKKIVAVVNIHEIYLITAAVEGKSAYLSMVKEGVEEDVWKQRSPCQIPAKICLSTPESYQSLSIFNRAQSQKCKTLWACDNQWSYFVPVNYWHWFLITIQNKCCHLKPLASSLVMWAMTVAYQITFFFFFSIYDQNSDLTISIWHITN